MTQKVFALKYRPQSLDEVIGHEQAVTRLRGMRKKDEFPNALLFCGPTSVGKTTLARALAADINGRPAAKQQDYMELNGTDQRSIDDIRNMIQISKFKPSSKKRIIVIDEAQGIISNAPAAAALLKPLEEPSPDTLWILCSMEPSKFGNGNGKAIANRCTQFVLSPPSNMDCLKQATRIAKGEKMSYLDKELLKDVVRACGSEMRTLANLMQGISDYVAGLDKTPKTLSKEMLSEIIASTESADDKLVAPVLAGVFAGKYAEVQKSLLYVQDGFAFINKLLWASSFLLNVAVLNGQKHPKVWWTPSNRETLDAVKKSGAKPTLGQYAAVQAAMVETKCQAAAFAVGETELLSAKLYRTIMQIHHKG